MTHLAVSAIPLFATVPSAPGLGGLGLLILIRVLTAGLQIVRVVVVVALAFAVWTSIGHTDGASTNRATSAGRPSDLQTAMRAAHATSDGYVDPLCVAVKMPAAAQYSARLHTDLSKACDSLR
jgi:hypothetical protein